MTSEQIHVRASELEAHCRVLASECHPISMAQWRDALAGGAPLPERPVLVTFDDGYRTVATVARPILERHHVPYSVFVCSDSVEQRTLFWYDAAARRLGEREVQRLKQVPFETWSAVARSQRTPVHENDPHAPLTIDDIRALAGAGCEIGGHTASHPILARAEPAAQRRDIERNFRALEKWLGRPVTAFAYPNGEPQDYTATTVSIVRDLGVSAAFTTVAGFASRGCGLECPRFLMLAGVSAAELAHRLSYSWRT